MHQRALVLITNAEEPLYRFRFSGGALRGSATFGGSPSRAWLLCAVLQSEGPERVTVRVGRGERTAWQCSAVLGAGCAAIGHV